MLANLVGFVALLSAASHFEQRMAVRQTWGSQLGVPYKFFLCNPHNDTVVKRMLKEADEYKDMIYFDHIDDSYKNITYITHNMFLYAARQPGLHGAYFYKGDDNTYVHTARFRDFLMHQPRNWSYIGQMYDANRVTRDPDLKWHLTYEEWPHDRWLARYAAGGSGYLLSWDMFTAIVATQSDPPRNIIPIYEDASVGLWVEYVSQTLQVDVQYVSSSLFNEFGCQDGLHEVTSHPVTPKQMLCLYGGKCRCVAEQGIVEIGGSQ